MLLLYYMTRVAGLLLHTVFYIYCYLFLGTIHIFILHFKIIFTLIVFIFFLYFQNKIHISYYCDFYSGLIQKKIISPCMLKNTNFAFFIFCFMHVLTKPRQYSFTLTSVDLGLSNHMHFFVA